MLSRRELLQTLAVGWGGVIGPSGWFPAFAAEALPNIDLF